VKTYKKKRIFDKKIKIIIFDGVQRKQKKGRFYFERENKNFE
jgi:hypothetical protein